MTDGIYKHFSKEQVSELNEKGKFLWRLDSAGREQWVTKESIERRLQISMREYSERIPGNIDVLTVHGTQDDIIPVRDALLFHESVGGQHHLLKEIEGANHFYSSDDQMIAMCQQVYNFILQKWGQ